MEFYIEKHSSIPIVSQIKDQIKFAVMMGIFRDGDTLPSIRDIEKQTGINRSQIHRAYLGLRQSGLLVLIRGKGTVVSTASESIGFTSESCSKLSRTILSRIHRLGLSPVAFSRYFSRYAQDSERNSPFIIYVDGHKDIAAEAATEISQLWQVPVKAMAFGDVKSALSKEAVPHRILVNHLMCDYVRSLVPGKKAVVIPIQVRVSDQSLKLLARIKPNSSVMIVHMPQPLHRSKFIVAQLQKLATAPGIKFSSASTRDIPSYAELLKDSQFDYYIIGPGVRGEIPPELRQNPRILPIYPALDPTSLEAARIRAGIVI